MKENKLQIEIKTLIIESSGKTKEEALGKAFSIFRKKIQNEVSGMILKIEPLETYLLSVKEEKKVEKFLELFMPREKIKYFIEIEIKCEVKYMEI